MNIKNIKIAGSDKTYTSLDEILEEWKAQDDYFKKSNYLKWLLLKIKNKINFFFDKLKTVFYNTKYGIENIIKWLPVIWKDRDWDYIYTLTILKKKIELQKECVINNPIHEGDDEIIQQMTDCIEVLKRIINDDYDGISYEYKNNIIESDFNFLFENLKKNITSWWN